METTEPTTGGHGVGAARTTGSSASGPGSTSSQSGRRIRRAFLLCVSVAGVVAAVWYAGPEQSIALLANVDLHSLALAGVAMLAGIAASIFRFRSVLRAFGHVPDVRTLLSAFFVGHLSNAFLMNVVGQSVTRAGLLRAADIPSGVTVAATFWERLQAAGVLFLAALAGGLVLLGNLSLDLQSGGTELVWLLVGLAVAAGAASIVAVRVARPAAPLAVARETLRDLGPSLLLTVAVHACTLFAWFAVLDGVVGAPASIEVGAALLIVMFASSVPISMAGWGLRELSAAHALAVVGIAPAGAVAAAVTVGGIGLGIVALSAVLAAVLARVSSSTPAARAGSIGPLSRLDTTRALPVIGILVTAVLLYFQVRLPVGAGELTVNLADPAAMTAGGLLLVQLLVRRNFGPVPRIFAIWLLALTGVIATSLVVGYARYGLNEWATWNRGVGWLVLLGYVAAGAAVMYADGRARLRLILGGLVASGLALTVLQLLAFAFDLSTGLLTDIQIIPLLAYAGNENAYAVQLIGVLAVVAAVYRARLFNRSPLLLIAAIGIISSGMYLTYSRTGSGMLVLALLLIVVTSSQRERWMDVWRIIGGLVIGAAIVCAVYVFPEVIQAADPRGVARDLANAGRDSSQSDTERWQSMVEGWELWIANPVLGSGLGAQVERYTSVGEFPLVIHNTPLWLLAETGIIGLAVALGGLFPIVVWAWFARANPVRAPWALGAGIIVVCVAGGGLFHDFAYQRTFWFLLAMFLALGLNGWRDGSELRREKSRVGA